MTRLAWDITGERLYETGVDHGVLFTQDETGEYETGVPWNGLTSVTESPTGAEPTPIYADNTRYLNLVSREWFGASIEAFTYPPEFGICDGTAEPQPGVLIGQQSRRNFGLSYRTQVGNDIVGADHGYKIHLIYGALAAPSEKAYATINETPEAITFSWELTTTPVELGLIGGVQYKPTASITIDSTTVDPADLLAFETMLYGSASIPGTVSTLPDPAAVIAMFAL